MIKELGTIFATNLLFTCTLAVFMTLPLWFAWFFIAWGFGLPSGPLGGIAVAFGFALAVSSVAGIARSRLEFNA